MAAVQKADEEVAAKKAEKAEAAAAKEAAEVAAAKKAEEAAAAKKTDEAAAAAANNAEKEVAAKKAEEAAAEAAKKAEEAAVAKKAEEAAAAAAAAAEKAEKAAAAAAKETAEVAAAKNAEGAAAAKKAEEEVAAEKAEAAKNVMEIEGLAAVVKSVNLGADVLASAASWIAAAGARSVAQLEKDDIDGALSWHAAFANMTDAQTWCLPLSPVFICFFALVRYSAAELVASLALPRIPTRDLKRALKVVRLPHSASARTRAPCWLCTPARHACNGLAGQFNCNGLLWLAFLE